MLALLLCIIAGLGAYVAGRRALWAGCAVALVAGYGYGILRANLVTPFSHFIFDSGVVGVYASQFLRGSKKQPGMPRDSALRIWVAVLCAWPIFLVFMPFQPLVVSIVGLRAAIFLFPSILLGSRLQSKDLKFLALSMAVLNLGALVFGVMEYFRGIEPFFPPGPMTITIYNSQDSGGGYRVPSTFQNAHTYAGVMVDTIPFLFGYWAQRSGTRKEKWLLLSGMGAAFFGILMAATRTGIIGGLFVAALAATSGKMGGFKRWIWAAALGGVILAAMSNDRWQRYKELDQNTVTDRIAGSVNRRFFEILVEYPMGNGLGGGGTSIPYFLASRVNRPVGVENEYARILLEEGVIGLVIWSAFAIWFMTNRSTFVKDDWFAGRRMAWWLSTFALLSAALGLGLLSSVPNSFLFLLMVGWAGVKPKPEQVSAPRAIRPMVVPAGGRQAFGQLRG
jgi:hypothetical protein